MEISDVRVKLIREPNDRLKAVCSITLDDEFVVRDLKVVEGTQGLFVAMPSRKLSTHCPKCRQKNHMRAKFCNECGAKLPPLRTQSDPDNRVRLHRDVAHPINSAFRETVQTRVIEAFNAELEAANEPGYQQTDLDSEEPAGNETPTKERIRSEYDALIAGLNGGKEGAGSERRESRRPPREERPAPRETPTAETREDEVPLASETKKASPEPAPFEEKKAPPEPAPSEDKAEVAPEPVTADRSSSGNGSTGPPSADDEGDTPFGAGIL